MEFLCSFLRRHLAGKPVVASPNVRCILRLNEQVCINICDLMIARFEHRSCFILFTKERLDKFVLSLCPFFLLLQDHWNHKILKIADVTFRKIKDCGR